MRLWDGRVSLRVRTRPIVVCGVLAAVLVVAVVVGLPVQADMAVPDVLTTLSGHGDRASEFLVYELALPRLLCAICVGMALGVSGAVFQSISRNPLGSPDIIGFTAGSAAGAVFVITVLGGGILATQGGALAGGAVTAAVVYLLARRDGAQGYQLVLIGIGANAMLHVVISYLLTRAELNTATTAQVWLLGSLNGRGWERFWPMFLALVVLLPAVLALTGRLAVLELGDEPATALGIAPRGTRLVTLVLGVALVAGATATAGPVSFVALAAPQLARRLTKASGVGVMVAALVGAVLTVLADMVAQRLVGVELPVGVATGALGGVYLAWLLACQWRMA